jgi:hypothetical protein
VQPVWVEIERTSQLKWLLRTGTDPDYFSPLEVAWSAHAMLGGSVNAAIDEHFDKLGFKNPIAPGTTRAGIIFTNPERGMKLFNVDVLGRQTLVPFTLFLPVPQKASAGGATAAQIAFLYPASELTDYRDLGALRAALERLPGAAAQGEPLNVVLVGELEDIGAALASPDIGTAGSALGATPVAARYGNGLQVQPGNNYIQFSTVDFDSAQGGGFGTCPITPATCGRPLPGGFRNGGQHKPLAEGRDNNLYLRSPPAAPLRPTVNAANFG